jgi:hypothetical protein
MENGGVAPPILNLGTRWRWVVSFALRALNPRGMSPRYPLDGRLSPCLQVVTPCNDVVGYQRFGGLCCLHLQVVTPCSDLVGYQRFGGLCCLHLQHIQEAARSFETLVSYHITTRCGLYRLVFIIKFTKGSAKHSLGIHVPDLKLRFFAAVKIHVEVTTQKTWTWLF